MLKIKDNVDLKELRNYGFIRYGADYIKTIACNAGISIDIDREISI